MKSTKEYIRTIAESALFCAIIFAVTAYMPRIPLAGQGGYIHLGDAFVYLAGAMLPLPFSVMAAGLGGALADLLTGYAVWAPASFVIKALAAFCFTSRTKKILCKRNFIAQGLAAVITIAGYYLFEAIISNNFAAPLASVLPNLAQAAAASIIFCAFAPVADKIRAAVLSRKS